MHQPDGTWKEVSYDDAVEYTAQMLAKAKKPLMYGWSSTNCEAQSVGNEIAEITRACCDNTAAVCHGTTLIAVQDIGLPTCTLGEVKNRADRIIFWGCNPAHAHPRHMSRYSIFPRGFFTGKGQMSRKMIVVDPRVTDTAKMADVHLQIEQGKDYELLNALRVAFKGEWLPDVVAGIPKEKIREAADMMKSGRFGIIFFGMGVTQSLGKNHNIDEAIAVTKDLNEYTKFSIMPMRGHYNVTGSVNEILVGVAEDTGKALGMSQIFIGIVFLAIIGGAAESVSAIALARKDKMDLSVGIALGSSIQIALFVAPVLVFASYLIGPQPLELSFGRAEVGSLFIGVFIGTIVCGDGHSNWFKGVQLVTVYIIIAAMFYFIPEVNQ